MADSREGQLLRPDSSRDPIVETSYQVAGKVPLLDWVADSRKCIIVEE
jgi:hypothetical protein